MSPTPTAKLSGQSRKIDERAFIKYMKNVGRAYRKQATELVSICRTFVQAQEQTPDSDAKLRVALQLVDNALQYATDAKKKTSEAVDEKFEKAIKLLSEYEKEWHSEGTVTKRMVEAKAKDKSSLTILNKLKEKFHATEDMWSEPTTVVEFLLFKSLPDDKPTVVQQVLGKSSNLAEVLWNFSRRKDEKRLTLRENPHFYKGLPASPEAYGDGFRLDPIDDFLDPPRVYVLIDRPGRLYLESDGSCWAFGNVWVPNKSIIFKNVCGKLEGEGIVGASIQDKPNLRYHLEDTSSTNSVGWKSIQDWRDPIRRMLKSQDISIRIGAEQYKTPQTNPLLRSNPRHRPSGSSNPAKPTHSGDAPPSSVLTLPPPTLQTGIPSKDGAAPSASLSRESPTSSLTDQATRAPASSIALTSRNISQPSESQAGAITKDTPSISRKLIVEGHTSTLSVAVTSLPGVTSPPSRHAKGREAKSGGNAPNQADVPGHKLEGATGMAPKPDAPPPPSHKQGTPPAKRQVWQVWFQKYVWKG